MSPDPTSLDRLHDVVVPPPVPWWPPAPGWYWVLGAASVLLLITLVRGFLHWQRNRYRREALAEWRRIAPGIRDAAGRASALAALAELLKRAALSAFPRQQVAALTGAQWLAFLDRTGNTRAFSSGAGPLLEAAAYDPQLTATLDEENADEAAALVRDWLKHHRTEGPTGC